MDPVRWQSHEALFGREDGRSSKSDVWSYGVTLWEILTLGATPYAQVASSEVGRAVLRGLRLPGASPRFSEEAHSLMLDCWQVDADERPTFEEILHRLERMAEPGQAVVGN